MPVEMLEKKTYTTVRHQGEGFVVSQFRQLREGGSLTLKRKIGKLGQRLARLPLAFLGVCLALPIFILARIIRPWRLIRFGALRSNRFGHFAAEPELYLCARERGLDDATTWDFFYHMTPVSNRQLATMWARRLSITPLAKWAAWLNYRIPGGFDHQTPPMFARDTFDLTDRTSAQLSFTKAEEKKGARELVKMGVKPEQDFICFHARDEAYLEKFKKHLNPDGSWRYHDFRDASIQNCLLAAEELTQKGYAALRMGYVVKEDLNSANPQIIDYAVNHRSDFMDIYLSAKCRFFICSSNGVCSAPAIFRRPIAFVNFVPLADIWTWSQNFLLIFKKYWLIKNKKFMTFKEVFESGAGLYYFTDEFKKNGIEPVENTAEEIRDVALEMDHRLNGDWEDNSELEKLQEKFWSIFPRNNLHGSRIRSRIGTNFLWQNRDLLK